jgi:hypothetical protein
LADGDVDRSLIGYSFSHPLDRSRTNQNGTNSQQQVGTFISRVAEDDVIITSLFVRTED